MEVILADKAGFCFGVKRGTETAFDAASKGKVYCLGPLIHNPQEVERLSKAGVETVDELTALMQGDVLIIRSHGVPPSVIASAGERGLTVIDLTCPFVGKAQRHAETLAGEGYQVVVVGEKEHPEVRSILGHGGERAVDRALDTVEAGLGDPAGLPALIRNLVTLAREATKTFDSRYEVINGSGK